MICPPSDGLGGSIYYLVNCLGPHRWKQVLLTGCWGHWGPQVSTRGDPGAPCTQDMSANQELAQGKRPLTPSAHADEIRFKPVWEPGQENTLQKQHAKGSEYQGCQNNVYT